MKFKINLLLSILLLLIITGCEQEAKESVTITLWDISQNTTFRDTIVSDFMVDNPGITVNFIHKATVEVLREDYVAQSANPGADVLLTVTDHFGPFFVADLLEPVDDLVDITTYVDTMIQNSYSWAVPYSSGNHLMLLYNKSLITTPPTTTGELLSMGAEFTTGDNYGLVYNVNEAFWLAPWLGGFDGEVFDTDGVTPTLDTPEMVEALTFVKSLTAIMPPVVDYEYNDADAAFKAGTAAMIINGDWSLGAYEEILGDNLGVTRIPMVSSTSIWPKPYISGNSFMVTKDISGTKKIAVSKLIQYFTSLETQTSQVTDENIFPGLLAAFDITEIQDSEVLAGSALQLKEGIPMPTVIEMRSVWDAIILNLPGVLDGSVLPEDAAEAMQSAALAGIELQ